MNQRMLSPDVDVYWMGWRSTTHELGRYGWDLSAHEQPRDNRIQIAIRHNQAGIYGMSDTVRHRYHDDWARKYYDGNGMTNSPLSFRMTLAHSIAIHNAGLPMTLWEPVDPLPTVQLMDIQRIEDLRIFRTIPSGEKDIILPPPSFDQILQMALDHQAPKQKELRQKGRQQMGAILRVAA